MIKALIITIRWLRSSQSSKSESNFFSNSHQTHSFLETTTGNLITNCVSPKRKPAMAAADNPRSFYSGSNPPHPNRFVFSADPPPKISLTPDQLNYCSEALKLFSQKLQMPDEINIEFSNLQVLFTFSFLLHFNFVYRKWVINLLFFFFTIFRQIGLHLRGWWGDAQWLLTVPIWTRTDTLMSYHVLKKVYFFSKVNCLNRLRD